MDIVDLLKLLGGLGGVLGLVLAGLFGLSKFKNSKLHSTFEKLANSVEADKEKVHELEIVVGKGEQKKEDLQNQIDVVDKQLEQVEKDVNKEATNSSIIDMFDKLSKK